MKAITKERIKDIIIDFLYDYSFTNKVKVLEGDGITIKVDPKFNIAEDPFLKSQSDIIKKSKKVSLRYEVRNEPTCEIISDKVVTHADLIQRLNRLGIYKSDELGPEISTAVQFLLDRSFLYKDQPIDSKVGLTIKGIKHYESGNSFEDNYLKKELLIKSDKRSKTSKVIAIISLVISGLIGLIGLYLKLTNGE